MIYLDYNASTPIDPAVRDAMLPYLGEFHGNPSSTHAMGKPMRAAVDRARAQLAALIGAKPEEIIFTSGGSEANNHVIKGAAFARRDRGRHLITSIVDHPATLNPCRFLAQQGYEITHVGVDRFGRIDPGDVIAAIRPDTILISIMHSNNEVGTLQPIAELSQAAHRQGVWLHTDAAQSCGKVPVHVDDLGVDLLSIAGHKVYAPTGIGALYMRSGIELEPLIHGAGHEKGRRSGTEPVPAIVGLGMAVSLAARSLTEDAARMKSLRDRLYAGLKRELGDGVVLNGHPELRLPNTLNVSFTGRIGRHLLEALPDICASPGAACHSDRHEPSHVLTAMGVPIELGVGAIRFSVGRYTTPAEVDEAVACIASAVKAG